MRHYLMQDIERLTHRISYLQARKDTLIQRKEQLCNKKEDVKFFGITFWRVAIEPDTEEVLDLTIRINGLTVLIEKLKLAEKMLVDNQAGELRVSAHDIINLIAPYKA